MASKPRKRGVHRLPRELRAPRKNARPSESQANDRKRKLCVVEALGVRRFIRGLDSGNLKMSFMEECEEMVKHIGENLDIDSHDPSHKVKCIDEMLDRLETRRLEIAIDLDIGHKCGLDHKSSGSLCSGHHVNSTNSTLGRKSSLGPPQAKKGTKLSRENSSPRVRKGGQKISRRSSILGLSAGPTPYYKPQLELTQILGDLTDITEEDDNNTAILTGETCQAWPKEVLFTNMLVFHPHQLLSARPTRQCNRVVIRDIQDPRHPCLHEKGVFATENIAKGTWLMDYTGLVVRNSDIDQEELSPQRRQYSRYLVPLVFRDKEGKTTCLDVDAANYGNESRFINDYRDTGFGSNVEFTQYFLPTGEMKIGVCAIRVIPKGSELLADYGMEYWQQIRANSAWEKDRKKLKRKLEMDIGPGDAEGSCSDKLKDEARPKKLRMCSRSTSSSMCSTVGTVSVSTLRRDSVDRVIGSTSSTNERFL
ncbi:hypothetical protein AAMO2058_000569600 [Amorphochlora amoebiformis]